MNKPGSSFDPIIPRYLVDTYHWAYLSPRWVPLLDHSFVVNGILWGQSQRLINEVLKHITPDQVVLQAACVYGHFSHQVVAKLKNTGHLYIVDAAPIQLRQTAAKLKSHQPVSYIRHDLTVPLDSLFFETMDTALCFFLLHEVPHDQRHLILRNLVATLKPGGKLVIVDYHQPQLWHPLRPLMALIFAHLEPFAPSWLSHGLGHYLQDLPLQNESQTLLFGDLYQAQTFKKTTQA